MRTESVQSTFGTKLSTLLCTVSSIYYSIATFLVLFLLACVAALQVITNVSDFQFFSEEFTYLQLELVELSIVDFSPSHFQVNARYPTLPYPTLPYPTLSYPTLPYPTIYRSCVINSFCNEGIATLNAVRYKLLLQ